MVGHITFPERKKVQTAYCVEKLLHWILFPLLNSFWQSSVHIWWKLYLVSLDKILVVSFSFFFIFFLSCSSHSYLILSNKKPWWSEFWLPFRSVAFLPQLLWQCSRENELVLSSFVILDFLSECPMSDAA